MIDKQKRRELAEAVKNQYWNLDTPCVGKPQFEWLQKKAPIGGFIGIWEQVRDYYKGHPDGMIDSLALYIYLLFMDDLEKAIHDESIDSRVKAYAESLSIKLKGIMDDILLEATNSADNFPEYL